MHVLHFSSKNHGSIILVVPNKSYGNSRRWSKYGRSVELNLFGFSGRYRSGRGRGPDKLRHKVNRNRKYDLRGREGGLRLTGMGSFTMCNSGEGKEVQDMGG